MNDQPPYDNKPCPARPMEVRNLYAVAHNLLNGIEAGNQRKIHEELIELRKAVEAIAPLVEKHFEDRAHAYPPNTFDR